MTHPDAPNDTLPTESVPPVKPRVVAGVVAGAVAVVILANFAVAPIDKRFNRSSWLLDRKWSLIDDPDRKVDVVVLGDSSGNQAVVPSVLEARLGVSSVNLATFGLMAVAGDVWMLEEYIRQHGPPRAVVAVHVHDIWPRTPDAVSAAAIPRPWSFWMRQVPPLVTSRREKITFAVARYVPLYSRTYAVAKLLQHPLETFSTKFALDAGGFMPISIQNDLAAQTLKYRKEARENPFSISSVNRIALERMLQIAERYGFDLFFASGPLYRPLGDDPAFREYLRVRDAALQEFASRSPRLKLLLDPSFAFYEAEHLESVDHNNIEGARVYTERLAAAIASAVK